MKVRTVKEFRDSFLAKGLAPDDVELLLKAKGYEADSDEEDEDDEDEDEDDGDEADAKGEELAKARKQLDRELAKAAKIKTDVYSVSDGVSGGSGGDAVERYTVDRTPIDEESIDTINPAEILKDIVKAELEAQLNEFAIDIIKSQAKDNAELRKLIVTQGRVIAATSDEGASLRKALKVQNQRLETLTKALGETAAPHKPKYTVDDVDVLTRENATNTKPKVSGKAISKASLEEHIGNELERLSKAQSGAAERQLISLLSDAMFEIDGTNDQAKLGVIAQRVGFKV